MLNSNRQSPRSTRTRRPTRHSLRWSTQKIRNNSFSSLFWTTTTIIATITTLIPRINNSIFCYGFPNILTTSTSGCMTELSVEEVIMNNQVVPYEKSSQKDIKLVVMDMIHGNGEWMDGPIIEFDNTYESPPMYKIKMIVPEGGPSDVQYAIDTTEGGIFTSSSAGCDGKRDSSRVRNDPGVEFQLKQQNNNNDDNSPIHVWAGWATGHEAVQLTDVLTFRPRLLASNRSIKKETPNNNEMPCTDVEEELCPGWAAKGQCTENPTYMLVNCRKSCKVCDHDHDIFGSPPKEQDVSQPEKVPQPEKENEERKRRNKEEETRKKTTTKEDPSITTTKDEKEDGKKKEEEGLNKIKKKDTKKKEINKQHEKPKRRKHDADGLHGFQLEEIDRERREKIKNVMETNMKERDDARPKKEKSYRKKFDLSDLEEIPRSSLGVGGSKGKGGIFNGYANENYGQGNFNQGGFVRGSIVLVGGLLLVIFGCTGLGGRDKRHNL